MEKGPSQLRFVDLSVAMGLSPEVLGHLLRHIETHYKPRRTKLIKGKLRPIDAPTRHLKKLLRRLHRLLVAKFVVHPCVHGGAKGRSCVSGAAIHCGARIIGIRDLKNAYPSISKEMPDTALRKRGVRHSVAAA